MKMKKIICHVELWDTFQHPVLLDCGKITELPECPLERLDEMLAMYSKKYELIFHYMLLRRIKQLN